MPHTLNLKIINVGQTTVGGYSLGLTPVDQGPNTLYIQIAKVLNMLDERVHVPLMVEFTMSSIRHTNGTTWDHICGFFNLLTIIQRTTVVPLMVICPPYLPLQGEKLQEYEAHVWQRQARNTLVEVGGAIFGFPVYSPTLQHRQLQETQRIYTLRYPMWIPEPLVNSQSNITTEYLRRQVSEYEHLLLHLSCFPVIIPTAAEEREYQEIVE